MKGSKLLSLVTASDRGPVLLRAARRTPAAR
jgi:hypothetical protein